MRVLFVLEHFHPYIGGAENLFKQLTEKLRKQGYLYKDLRRLTLRFFSNRQSFISKYNLTNANDLVKEIL